MSEFVLQEFRCPSNNKLLYKARGEGQVEMINPSNRFLSYTGPSRKSQDFGPKGIDFQKWSVDLKCKNCGRLLGRAVGTDLEVETKCRYCKTISTFSLEKMQKGILASLSKKQLEMRAERKKFDKF